MNTKPMVTYEKDGTITISGLPKSLVNRHLKNGSRGKQANFVSNGRSYVNVDKDEMVENANGTTSAPLKSLIVAPDFAINQGYQPRRLFLMPALSVQTAEETEESSDSVAIATEPTSENLPE